MSIELSPKPEDVHNSFIDALALERVVQESLGVQNGYPAQQLLTQDDMKALFDVSHGVGLLRQYSQQYATEHLETLEAMAREDMQQAFTRRQNGSYDDGRGPGMLEDKDNIWNDGEEPDIL